MVVTQEKCFYFTSGRKAYSIEELSQVLKDMGDAEFRHHVNNERNDFANWVEDVFKESELAHNMREVSEKEGLIIILEDFLKKRRHEHKHHKKIRRVIIPENKRTGSVSEKELSEKKIKSIVHEAKQMLEEEEHKARKAEHPKPEQYRFIVKEFIYGFLLGLIFGLIMLGIIFNLNF